jgi:antagonist of KipI
MPFGSCRLLEVVEPGLLTTVQGRGRPDAVDLGVPVGGACDPWSLAVANALVGNPPTNAALEMTLAGATFRVLEDCILAVAGADMGDGVPIGRSVQLRRGETIAFGAARAGSGVRTYLAMGGSIDVPEVLGARSTCLVGGFGGLDGRTLRAGDVIRSREARRKVRERDWPGAVGPLAGPLPHQVRVVRGPDADEFAGAYATMLDTGWTVSGRGDRQGIRLDGPALSPETPATMLSRGMTWGTVQLPPDGVPIILLADHQTVGGYPAIAVVISADRPLIGQLGPGDDFRFSEVSLAEGQRLLRAQADEFERVAESLA